MAIPGRGRPPNPPINIERLAGDMKRKRWDHVSLAHELGVNPTTVGRWLGRKNQPSRLDVEKIASTMGREIAYYYDLAGRDQEPSQVYRFTQPPRVIMSAWEQSDGSYSPHQADIEAYNILAKHMRGSGIFLDSPLICEDSSCPDSFYAEDLILICGPVFNKHAGQLNDFLSISETNSFFFKRTVENPSLELGSAHKEWTIAHSALPRMEMRLLLKSESSALVLDYGIFYIGENPRTPDCYLLWVAGYGQHGTPGAARAFVEPAVQTEIAQRFKSGQKYVSALVCCECVGFSEGRTIRVMFA